ncbi:hypothetical protein EZV62_026206 [Acer yangbiense]|uniref:Cytochrome P450 n=1 Tax=Acer yangbiense TaxID=1000413 RepID=A0A5C7GRH4_9ROSI|nr:hypothetical protein EZV62_026206 [Acer yangbiense]
MLLQLGKVATLVISSPEIAKQVLKTHDLECCSRPLTQGPRRLSYNFLDIVFSPYTDYWKEMKKNCVMELFNSKRVKSFASVREESVASLIDLISQTSPNIHVNLSEKMFYVLDSIICKIACGRSYQGKQFQNGSKHEEVIQEAMATLGSFSAADFFPHLGWIVDFFTGLHARREKCFHEFDEFYRMVIDEHLDPHRPVPENEDTVDSMLRLVKNQSDGGILTQDHIKAILMNVFIGAIDTTSVTLVWAMTELMKNPRVMKKLQAEIRSSAGKINKPLVEETVCENLKYLKMVFKETLRLHPPLVLSIPHLAQKHIKIGGYDVYPNTRIHVNVFAIGRDPETWKNPEEFYPERFENEAIGIDFGGQDFESLPFGSGRRVCPGMTMATAAFEFVLGNLLYHFDWKLPDGMETEDLSMEEELGLAVHKKIPLCLVPIKHI